MKPEEVKKELTWMKDPEEVKRLLLNKSLACLGLQSTVNCAASTDRCIYDESRGEWIPRAFELLPSSYVGWKQEIKEIRGRTKFILDMCSQLNIMNTEKAQTRTWHLWILRLMLSPLDYLPNNITNF